MFLIKNIIIYNRERAIPIAESSYYFAVRRAALKEGIVLPERLSALPTDSKCLVNLLFTNAIDMEVKQKVLKAIQDLKFTRLEMNIINGDIDDGKRFIDHCGRCCKKVNINKY